MGEKGRGCWWGEKSGRGMGIGRGGVGEGGRGGGGGDKKEGEVSRKGRVRGGGRCGKRRKEMGGRGEV